MKKNFCFTLKSLSKQKDRVVQRALKAAITILLLGSAIPAMAVDTTGRFRLGGNFFVGGAVAKGTTIDKTPDGEDVTLSGAGQMGFSLRVGYGLSPPFDIDIAAGEQASELRPHSAFDYYSRGNFESKFVVAALKYKIPVSDKSQLKIGGGLGYYYSGKTKLAKRSSQLSEGYETNIKYKGTVGEYLTGEYESFAGSKDWSFVVGLIYYKVKYDVDSATWNNADIPVSDLPDKLRSLDGSGVDVLFGIEKYF